MPLLDDVKLALRLHADQTEFDSEIEDLIAAARADLADVGVHPDRLVDGSDPIIKRAIVVYCKAHWGWENNDYERLIQAYDMLKGHLTLAGDYTQGPDGEEP